MFLTKVVPLIALALETISYFNFGQKKYFLQAEAELGQAHVQLGMTLVPENTRPTKNKNYFQCYYNNIGFCMYQHFKEVCSKSVCKDKEC